MVDKDQIGMRIFVSVNLPDQIQQELLVIQSRLRQSTQNWRWIDPATMHLTVKFIGKYPEDQLDRLEQCFKPVTATNAQFTVELGGFGTFPPRSKPSVLWIGLQKGAAQLTALADSVTKALQEAHIDADHKPFVPHITLARAKRNQTAYVPDTIQVPVSNTGMTVESFYVMESVLQPSGAQYTKRLEFKLKG
jgi:2'-5' RNA ligase